MSIEPALSRARAPAEPKVFGLIPLSKFYQGRRATPLGRRFSHFWAAWSALGLPSFRMVQLELHGAKTGRLIRLAVVPVICAGQQYLVSMLGECAWVRAARANPEAVLVKFRRRRVRLREIPVDQRAAIIQTFLRLAPGGRPHIGLPAEASIAACEAVAARHPVFGVDAA
jgi:hypothetical protein